MRSENEADDIPNAFFDAPVIVAPIAPPEEEEKSEQMDVPGEYGRSTGGSSQLEAIQQNLGASEERNKGLLALLAQMGADVPEHLLPPPIAPVAAQAYQNQNQAFPNVAGMNDGGPPGSDEEEEKEEEEEDSQDYTNQQLMLGNLQHG